ncbi:FecCD family ABC transporter permease [Brachybacterium hainanense]|uniref:FecCD family ABC transporter permease n=1 Tax=Brachybacterium hainanense TaxID=1541174 RepID=A0ABV6RCP1_9MICO
MTTSLAPAPASPAAGLRRHAATRLLWLGAMVVLLAVLMAASVSLGVRDVSAHDILAGLRGMDGTISQAAVVTRVPRTVLAALAGAALGLSGTAMQAVTRNPLADPGILGISGGASLAVVIGLVFLGIGAPLPQSGLAILGAALAAVFVYTVGSLGRGGATPLKLALAGAATTAATSSLVSAVLLPRIDVMTTFRFWQIGGVGGATATKIWLFVPFVAVGAVICLATSRGMNSLALGDELASALGENVARTRMIAAAGGVILCGAAVAATGPIGFVGLVVPHMCRLLIGADHRWLLPLSALAGACLLIAADVAGRLLVPGQELEVGIVTAVLGAPLFIAIVRRQKVREL